jgi:hypothetical protein
MPHDRHVSADPAPVLCRYSGKPIAKEDQAAPGSLDVV